MVHAAAGLTERKPVPYLVMPETLAAPEAFGAESALMVQGQGRAAAFAESNIVFQIVEQDRIDPLRNLFSFVI